MGLDITSQNDYFRFNWSGVRDFSVWNEKNGLPNPFPNWSGDNSGDLCNCNDPEDRKQVKEWLKAFEQAFPDLARRGVGESLRYMQFDVVELCGRYNKDENWSEEDKALWDSYTGLAWYWFLKDKLKTKAEFNYC